MAEDVPGDPVPSEENPLCCVCRKTPGELAEYRFNARAETRDRMMHRKRISSRISPRTFTRMTAAQWVRQDEGTWNPAAGLFCCTRCYIQIGMPNTATQWRPSEFIGGGSS